MLGKVEVFLEWAKKNGWEVLKRQDCTLNLPGDVLKRFPNIPTEFLEFLKLIEICITPDEKSWFICQNEYNGNSDLAFSWDELEKISLVEGDNSYNKPIIKFWDTHIPIALSVRSGYSYFALDLGSDFGSVVYGYEPEFEEPEKVASSFFEFLEMIMINSIEF